MIPLLPPSSPPLVVSSTAELRSGIARAVESQTSLSIHLPARTRFRLRGRALHLDCLHIESVRNVWVNISGDNVTLDGAGRSRIFEVRGPCSLSLTGLRLANGAATAAGAAGGVDWRSSWEGYGGAIFARSHIGTILLTSVTIADSHAHNDGRYADRLGATHADGGGKGGGVSIDGDTVGSSKLVMMGSLITGCSSGIGGAFRLKYSSATIYQSEIRRCNATRHGGGGYAEGITGVVDSALSTSDRLRSDSHGGVDLRSVSFERNTAPRGAALVVRSAVVETSNSRDDSQPVRARDVAFIDSQGSSAVWMLAPTRWHCPLGRWMSAIGEWNDFVSCAEMCLPGRVGTLPTHRNSSCGEPCPAGHYCGEGTVEPTPCPSGTISPTPGLTACSPCTHPLSSEQGSTSCAVCESGFYLRPPANATDDLVIGSAEHCHACPPHADCSAFNTTLETLGLPVGYWRASPATAEVYRCHDSDTCLGSLASAARARALGDHVASTGAYCSEGHAGPRCELCVDDKEYFSADERRCVACPTLWRRVVLFFSVSLGVAMLISVLYLGYILNLKRSSSGAQLVNRLTDICHSVDLQPKVKVLVSFYQICATLTTVYGVRLHASFSGWLDFVEVFSLDVLDLTFPSPCLGSMQTRLLVTALWPYAAVLVLSVGIAAHAYAEHALQERGFPSDEMHRNITASLARSIWPHERILSRCSCPTQRLRKILSKILLRCLSALVFVFYIVLPSVSRFIFEARRCESFAHDDATGKRISYLLADLSTNCNNGLSWSNGAHDLDAYFWTFFVLWPIAVPLTFLVLLVSSRTSLRAQRVTAAARATSFLWNDYEASFVFWEAIDLWRKVTSHITISWRPPPFFSPPPIALSDPSRRVCLIH